MRELGGFSRRSALGKHLYAARVQTARSEPGWLGLFAESSGFIIGRLRLEQVRTHTHPGISRCRSQDSPNDDMAAPRG